LNRYQWALIIGPKTEDENSNGRRFQAKERFSKQVHSPVPQSTWEYEEREISMIPSSTLLVRVLIGKIKDGVRMESILRETPLRPKTDGWGGVEWVKEALVTAFGEKGVVRGPKSLDWEMVRDTAMWYVEEKRSSRRFEGQADDGDFDRMKAPTWDLVERVELFS
jgi:hypothetical protein